MGKLKLYSSGANPIIYICFTLMRKYLISLIHDGYVQVSKEECILGNMYKSNSLHILSPVKCCTGLSSNILKTFAR